MRFNVAELVKAPTGTTRKVVLDEAIELEVESATVVGPVRGRLRFLRDHAGVLVDGRLSSVIATPCARCLEPATVTVEMEISEHFRPTVSIPGGSAVLLDPDEEDEPATRIDDKHVLDLSDVIGQMFITSMPLTPLCRPECRGLCPICGASLETQSCDCEPAPDPRWDALRALIEDEQETETDERRA